jgi:hypothetical protein
MIPKWHKRQTVEDRKTGPREPRSIFLSQAEEAMVMDTYYVALRDALDSPEKEAIE